MMRTTLQIDEQLFRAAKKAAAESGRTFTALVEDALRQALSTRKPPETGEPFQLPSLDMGETMPGVDFDNNAALLDLMESGDAPF
jgi:hypothetical protein